METSPPSTEGQLAQVGDLMISYEQFGDPDDETILLVMGLGMQLLGWDPEFCEMLVERGYHVVRFDNRDVGLSSKLSGRVNLPAGIAGFTGSAVYTLDEMAADTAGLLDHLGVGAAHLVGASMGGMISQKLAATRADRVLSLCSIMAGGGKRGLSRMPRPNALRMLLRSPASTREDFIDGTASIFDVIGSPGFPADAELLRERAGASYDRAFAPAGTARQLMAVLAAGNRTGELARVQAPTLVIHGSDDPLVPPAAGRDVAEAIDGARLEVIEGMGHDLPRELWPRFCDLIAENAAAAARA